MSRGNKKMNISRIIEMNKVANLRDLGGIHNKDGKKVRDGKVYRSALLAAADEKDMETLSAMKLSEIFDFRSLQEIRENPDPELKDCFNRHLPIYADAEEGITREEKKEDNEFPPRLTDPQMAKDAMLKGYTDFVEEEFCRNQYSIMLHEMLNALREDESASFLYHCTAGKDRTGFATAIILEILDVDKKDIIADYLLTNNYNQPDIDRSFRKLKENILSMDPEATDEMIVFMQNNIMPYFVADQDYLERSYSCIEKNYGSFSNYIENGLGINSDEKEEFKKYLLEK